MCVITVGRAGFAARFPAADCVLPSACSVEFRGVRRAGRSRDTAPHRPGCGGPPHPGGELVPDGAWPKSDRRGSGTRCSASVSPYPRRHAVGGSDSPLRPARRAYGMTARAASPKWGDYQANRHAVKAPGGGGGSVSAGGTLHLSTRLTPHAPPRERPSARFLVGQGQRPRYFKDGRSQRARRRAGAMQQRPGDRVLPGRVLHHRAGGPRQPHDLRGGHR